MHSAAGGQYRLMVIQCMFATMIRDQHLTVLNYPLFADGICLMFQKAMFFFSGWDQPNSYDLLWFTMKWGTKWRPWRHILATLPD